LQLHSRHMNPQYLKALGIQFTDSRWTFAGLSWLWGFPHRFQERMDRVDTRVVLVGGDGSDFSSGFDTAEDVKRLPSGFSGVIWTNRIDRIAPLYGKE
ncbi:hypothetical protein ACQKK5_25860, partial [Brevibacillus panacihumi]